MRTGVLEPTPEVKGKDSPTKSDIDTKSVTTTDLNDPKMFEGLTAKQKKNLRKKLQRKKKKAANKESQSAIDDSMKSDSRCSNESPDAGQDVPKG